jgi:hypothetical protein
MANIGPNTTFDQFLKAFDTSTQKGSFCHRLTQNLDKYLKENPELGDYKDNVIELLKHSKIPGKKWFYNELKKTHIGSQEYEKIKTEYSNVYNLLVDYNNKDVFPAIEATIKLATNFRDIGLDIHKDAISISGLALKYLWKTKSPNASFQLFKGYEELYFKYKNNLVGGPSIVFNHYQERNKTKIRNGKLCKSIQGFDANALYLWALTQDASWISRGNQAISESSE